MSPQRIQRKRTRGWRMPNGAVYVGRPSKWGNPWSIGEGGLVSGPGLFFSADPETSQAFAVRLFEDWLAKGTKSPALMCGGPYPAIDEQRAAVVDGVRNLAGRDLACWCRLDQPCHADVLLELANGSSK